MFDGISGLVTQPISGAKKEGVAGFVKGFGKGVGGLILKPGAGEWRPDHQLLVILTDYYHSRLGLARIHLQGHLQGDTESPRSKCAELYCRSSYGSGL